MSQRKDHELELGKNLFLNYSHLWIKYSHIFLGLRCSRACRNYSCRWKTKFYRSVPFGKIHRQRLRDWRSSSVL